MTKLRVNGVPKSYLYAEDKDKLWYWVERKGLFGWGPYDNIICASLEIAQKHLDWIRSGYKSTEQESKNAI